jgi:hypothetical protein
LFAFILPWTVAGFRNAVIGLIFMQLFPRCRGCSDTRGRIDPPGQRNRDGVDCNSSVRSQRAADPHYPKLGSADAIEGKKSKEAPAREDGGQAAAQVGLSLRSQQKAAGNMTNLTGHAVDMPRSTRMTVRPEGANYQ